MKYVLQILLVEYILYKYIIYNKMLFLRELGSTEMKETATYVWEEESGDGDSGGRKEREADGGVFAGGLSLSGTW